MNTSGINKNSLGGASGASPAPLPKEQLQMEITKTQEKLKPFRDKIAELKSSIHQLDRVIDAHKESINKIKDKRRDVIGEITVLKNDGFEDIKGEAELETLEKEMRKIDAEIEKVKISKSALGESLRPLENDNEYQTLMSKLVVLNRGLNGAMIPGSK